MLEELFFFTGLVNSIYLICIFLVRKKENLPLLQKVGGFYFLLAIPSIYGIFLVQVEQQSVQYSIFLGIFLLFLLLEGVFDFILKIPFRKNWTLLTPYLILYFVMNYGFVIMVWKNNLWEGMILLALFIIQIIVNIWSHPRKSKLKT
jgi:hypothetical protein